MSETKSEFGFQIDESVKAEANPPKRKPKQKAAVEKPVEVKEEAEKLLFDEVVEAPKPQPPKPPVAKEEPKPEPKPAPVLKAPPVRPEPVLYGMKKVKRRMKVRRNLA